MAVKLMAFYATPDDAAAFDQHYQTVHTPIVESIPGLAALRISRSRRRLMGDADIYLVAEMVFPDRETFDKAMGSAENQAAGKDLANFARGKVTLVVAED